LDVLEGGSVESRYWLQHMRYTRRTRLLESRIGEVAGIAGSAIANHIGAAMNVQNDEHAVRRRSKRSRIPRRTNRNRLHVWIRSEGTFVPRFLGRVEHDEPLTFGVGSKGKWNLDLNHRGVIDDAGQNADPKRLPEAEAAVLSSEGEDVFHQPERESRQLEAQGAQHVERLERLMTEQRHGGRCAD
jgi:hypothetical protein